MRQTFAFQRRKSNVSIVRRLRLMYPSLSDALRRDYHTRVARLCDPMK